MNTIILPSLLPGELDLSEVNNRLRACEVTLDWSQVQEASPEQLAILLDGLDLVEHSEQLGWIPFLRRLAMPSCRPHCCQTDGVCSCVSKGMVRFYPYSGSPAGPMMKDVVYWKNQTVSSDTTFSSSHRSV